MSEKREVVTDAQKTLGTIIEAGERDAIHLAVEPVEAAERLLPGQHVGIVDGKATKKAEKKLGIVDPFIEDIVMPGEKFWLVVYPRKITSLRHVWTHPEFDVAPAIEMKATDKENSELVLRAIAMSIDKDYDTMMSYAKVSIEDRKNEKFVDYLTGGAEMEGSVTPDEFWEHYEIVTETKVPVEHRGNFFSCSC